MRIAFTLLAVVVLVSQLAFAADETAKIVTATDLSIPTSPAFTLLGVNPTKVTRPTFSKDFKLDILVEDNGLKPDLALAFKPVAMFVLQNHSVPSYRDMSPVLRWLTTLDISVGTTEKDTQKQFAWAATLTPWRHDPILDDNYVNAISDALSFTEDELKVQFHYMDTISELYDQIEELEEQDTLSDDEAQLLASLRSEVETWEREQETVVGGIAGNKAAQRKQVLKEYSEYLEKNWNRPILQIGAGQVFNYEDSSLKDLEFIEDGLGVWCNAAVGLDFLQDNKFLLSVLWKYIELDQIERLAGANLRYGGPKINGFVEFVYEEKDDVISKTITYGGEYRLDDNRAIEFGLRTDYDSSMNLSDLTPQVKLNWNLAKGL